MAYGMCNGIIQHVVAYGNMCNGIIMAQWNMWKSAVCKPKDNEATAHAKGGSQQSLIKQESRACYHTITLIEHMTLDHHAGMRYLYAPVIVLLNF
jgi:hypothetical protein